MEFWFEVVCYLDAEFYYICANHEDCPYKDKCSELNTMLRKLDV